MLMRNKIVIRNFGIIRFKSFLNKRKRSSCNRKRKLPLKNLLKFPSRFLLSSIPLTADIPTFFFFFFVIVLFQFPFHSKDNLLFTSDKWFSFSRSVKNTPLLVKAMVIFHCLHVESWISYFSTHKPVNDILLRFGDKCNSFKFSYRWADPFLSFSRTPIGNYSPTRVCSGWLFVRYCSAGSKFVNFGLRR